MKGFLSLLHKQIWGIDKGWKWNSLKKDVVSYYNITWNTLSTWLKNIDKIIKAIEREDKSKQKESSEPEITTTWAEPYISGLLKCKRKDYPSVVKYSKKCNYGK